MAEFWEQQMMDRLLNLAFEYKKNEKDVLPKEQIQECLDYVKWLLENNSRIDEKHPA